MADLCIMREDLGELQMQSFASKLSLIPRTDAVRDNNPD